MPATAEVVGRRPQGVEARPAAVDQGGRRPPVRPDHVRGPVDRVPLADAPEVDDDPRPVEGDGLPRGVEGEVARSGPRPGVGEGLRVGHALRPPGEPPGHREGAGGHVVGPAGRPSDRDGAPQEVEQAGLDLDRPEVGRRVQPGDLRLVVVDRQLAFERLDDVQGPGGQVDGPRDARAEADLEVRTHQGPAGVDQRVRPVERGRRAGRRRRDRPPARGGRGADAEQVSPADPTSRRPMLNAVRHHGSVIPGGTSWSALAARKSAERGAAEGGSSADARCSSIPGPGIAKRAW